MCTLIDEILCVENPIILCAIEWDSPPNAGDKSSNLQSNKPQSPLIFLLEGLGIAVIRLQTYTLNYLLLTSSMIG
jgi:hypothetical protein